MNDLIKEVIRFQMTNDELSFENIVNEVKPIITFNLKKVKTNDQDDLYQILLCALLDFIKK